MTKLNLKILHFCNICFIDVSDYYSLSMCLITCQQPCYRNLFSEVEVESSDTLDVTLSNFFFFFLRIGQAKVSLYFYFFKYILYHT